MSQTSRGSVLLMVLIFAGMIAIQVLFLAHMLVLVRQSSEDHYRAAKVYYVAVSGRSVALSLLSNLPEWTVVPDKAHIYSGVAASRVISMPVEGRVSLFKHTAGSHVDIYSVAYLLDGKSKAIVRFGYDWDNTKNSWIFRGLEKL